MAFGRDFKVMARRNLKQFWQGNREHIFMAIALILLTGVIVEGRHRGLFERLELQAYDKMSRRSPQLEADDRLVLVGIGEEDLRSQEKWPFPDEVYAKVLANLQKGKPAVIGLDVYRDFPVEPGYDALVEQFKQPNVIAIRNLDVLTGTPAPPSISPAQISFNDYPVDIDGVTRRSLLYAAGSDEAVLPSFSANIAMTYLMTQAEIMPQASEIDPNLLQLGQATFFMLTPESGGYQTLDARGYQFLFQYRDRQEIKNTLSFSDVLAGKFDATKLKGKIVLIGSTASSLKDESITPFTLGARDGKKMAGVAIHGQMISHILDSALGRRSQFRFWTGWQEDLWVVGWIVAGAGIGWILRHPLAITAGFGFGILGTTGSGFLLLQNYVWIPVATPLIGFFLSMGFVIVYQSYQDFRQQKMVMELLGQNTSPAIANALWEERSQLLSSGRLPGVSLTATMLFLDVRGFSTVSERMIPEKLLIWINELLEIITHEVQQRNGIVNKFTGDGVIAVFGVPVPRETPEAIAKDAQNCVAAAVAIAARLDEINQGFRSKNLPTIQLRIGIFTGDIVAGSLGGKERMEYGVIGDSVNTASRLESCAKERQVVDCRILIAKATQQYLGDRFAVESWGAMPLKGKADMVEVFRVLTPQETNTLTKTR